MTEQLHWQTRCYLGLTWVISAIAPWLIRARAAQHREDPARWREKLGLDLAPRRNRLVIWFHGVGIGELAALRGLVQCVVRLQPEIQVLITSSAKSSMHIATTFHEPQVTHQFCPLDIPQSLNRFLAHWQPAAYIVCDQDLWPRTLITLAQSKIPTFWVNARISERSLKGRLRLSGLYRDLLRSFREIHTTDMTMISRLITLGASADQVRQTPSLKRIAPPLPTQSPAGEPWWDCLSSLSYWVVVSSHAADETMALAAQRACVDQGSPLQLVLVPRDLSRLISIQSAIHEAGLKSLLISQCSYARNLSPADIIIVDQYGRLGQALRSARWALIGGTQDPAVGGHNPWEAVALECPIMAGQQTSNFTADYALLTAYDAVTVVTDAQSVIRTLSTSGAAQATRAERARLSQLTEADGLAQSIIGEAGLGNHGHA